MRVKFRNAFALLVAVFALCAISASAALAAPEWYSSATKPTAEWQQGHSKIAEAKATKWKGKVKLYDTDLPIEVECESAGEGTVGPGNVAKETSWTLSGCAITPKAINSKGEEVTNECTKLYTEKTKIDNLPWHSELVAEHFSLGDITIGEGATHPGFQIECVAAGIRLADVCTAEKLETTTPVNVTGGVEVALGGKGLNCNIGGHEKGWLQGREVIEATTGGKLEANLVEGTYSKVASSVAVSGASQVTLEDKGRNRGLICHVATGGTVEAGGKGTISSYSLTECKPVGECVSITKISLPPLPWATELNETAGTVRDRLITVTKAEEEKGGLWGFEFECTTGGTTVSDLCSLNVNPEASNGLEGSVFDVFGESLTKTTCNDDSKEGEAVWRGELRLAPASGAIEARK
jgi:hypothetical protein